MVESTIFYYQREADNFIRETLTVNMEALYKPFLSHLPANAEILDAGCGSGRDSLIFRERGYQVTAFDACPALASFAAKHSGIEVTCQRFEDIDWLDRFDGIWACASLLHVSKIDLNSVFHRLGFALKPGGVLYASFKYGQGEREHRERWFTDLDEAGLADVLTEVPTLTLDSTWVTPDQRPGRDQEYWLNVLALRPTHVTIL